MNATNETVKSSWIASLKSQPTLLPLLTSTPEEIREAQFQGSDFVYPAVRVSVDFRPSINRCGPDNADIEIICFSDQKSSKQSVHLASVIQDLYHGHTFKSNGMMFNTVIVRDVSKPNRSIYAWETTVKIYCQGWVYAP